MKSRSLKFLGSFFLLLLMAINASGQQAVVVHNVNLRPDPSRVHKTIRLLSVDEILQLVEPDPTKGYYHVRTDQNEQGWVWGRSIEIQASPTPGPPPTPAPSPTPTPAATTTPGGAPAAEISPDWEKPAPNKGTFQGAEGSCGETGDGGDADTNLLKNRTDTPSSYHEVTWEAVGNLAYPKAPTNRMNWSAGQLAQIEPYEGAAVSVVGYLYKIKVESGGSGESTNCHNTQASDVDWHMYLTSSAGQGEDTSLIVETTPRVREFHPNWTPQRLAPWSGSGVPVRMSGWLMLDPEHRNMVGKYRGTIWEIHPITKIEVFKDGQWVDLDQLP